MTNNYVHVLRAAFVNISEACEAKNKRYLTT